MLSVGEFSRRCRLPISTLHHYHAIGLIVPADVDARTGYRYYDPEQLETAVRISVLRSIGLRPNQIRSLLNAHDPAGSMAWSDVRASLVDDVSESSRRLHQFDELVAGRLTQSEPPSPRRTELSLNWAATETVTTSSEQIATAVRRGLAKLRATVDQPGALAATFPLDIDTNEVVVELHVEHRCYQSQSTVPALLVVHHGSHEGLWMAYRGLLDAAARLGHEPSGRATERYGAPTDGRATTEVFLHLRTERT